MRKNSNEGIQKSQITFSNSLMQSDKEVSDLESPLDMKKRMQNCLNYMKQSSLFCCHKKNLIRRKLILIVLGGTNKP